MHENMFKIFRNRVAVLSEKTYELIYPESIALKAEYARTAEPVPFRDRLKLKYRPVTEGEVWGKAWDSAWFHLTGVVPRTFAGKELCLRLRLGGEVLLFDAKGVPVFGLSESSVFEPYYIKEQWILKNVKPGSKIDIWAEAAANWIWGINLPQADERDPKEPLGSFHPTISSMRLCVFDRELWLFLLEMETLVPLLDRLGMNDYRGKQLLYALNKALDVYNYEPANASKARQVLKDTVFRWKAEDGALTANAIGHAHIDVGWLWKVRESTRKAARTFSSQLDLMERHPEFKFGASQAHLYREVKRNYPELFEKIKKRVREGRWELQGGMYVEADCNLISGESMVRQFLHGKNFFMDEFGVEVKNLWIPDVFGYSAAMPQIIRKARCDYFLTQKISWSQINKFPFHTFRWIGVDGSEVLTHFPPEDTYNSHPTAKTRIHAIDQFNEGGFLPGFMSLVGIGDGGGGPSEFHVERSRILSNLRGCPKSEWKFASDFFGEIAKYRKELPVWKDELYLEFHRGTLTTQARTKRGNRKCEQALTALEFLASCLPAAKYPSAMLDEAWKTVLLNQFHDIIPGSSIRAVYEQTEKEHANILASAEKELKKIFPVLFRKRAGSAVLANTLSCTWSGTLPLPESWNGCSVLDSATGKPLPAHVQDDRVYVNVSIPGGSFLTLEKGKKAPPRAKTTGGFVLENELIRYEMDGQGRLIGAFDKILKKEFMTGEGNVFSLYNDRPVTYDAWDIDVFYPRERKGSPACVSAKKVVSGPAGSSAEFVFRTEKSEIRQQVFLAPGSRRLDFNTEVDWQESRTMLRVAFPVSVRSDKATFDIQYAYKERTTHDNTSWDEAKFETCGQRYADLSDLQCGAALLNDCKYGYRVKGSVLDLALLRSTKYPDWFADQGKHRFTYSFLPHDRTLAESGVMQDAAVLNRAPVLADGFAAGSAAAPCRIDSDGISLEVVKRAEKDDSIILRLVETRGKFSRGTLDFAVRPGKVTETDLMEWGDGPALKLKGKTLALEMKPFEIRTLRVRNR